MTNGYETWATIKNDHIKLNITESAQNNGSVYNIETRRYGR